MSRSRRKKKAETKARKEAEKKANGVKEPIKVELVGSDESSFIEIFELTLMLHKEGGILPLDRARAAESVYNTLTEGMTLIARNESGEAIGTLGLTEVEIYYSTETMLCDKWLIVRSEHRNGDVGKELLRAATDIAEEKGKILVVTITNPNRQRKVPMKMSLAAQEVGYVPRSYSMRLR